VGPERRVVTVLFDRQDHRQEVRPELHPARILYPHGKIVHLGPLSLDKSVVENVAFATILAVVAGLTLAASSAFAHNFWMNVVKRGKESESERILVARIAAVVVGIMAVTLAINLPTANAAVLVAAVEVVTGGRAAARPPRFA
jgi:Na+(H+)/acetate symporter ActP